MIKVHWVTKWTPSDVAKSPLASIRFRLGALLHAKNLRTSSGLGVPPDADVVIWGKWTYSGQQSKGIGIHNLRIAQSLRARGTIQVMDYTDHHLSKVAPVLDGRSDLIQHANREVVITRKYYQALSALVDFITVPTRYVATALKEEEIQNQTWVVPDAIDQVPASFVKLNINQQKTGLWYGSQPSFPHLVNNLEKLDYALGEPFLLNCLVSPETIYNIKKQQYIFPKLKNIKLRIMEWSINKMLECAAIANLIILPASNRDKRRRLASENRLITGFSLLTPVVAGVIPSYSEFSDYFIDFESENLGEKLSNINKLISIEKAKNVALQYAPNVVGNKWEHAISTMINAKS